MIRDIFSEDGKKYHIELTDEEEMVLKAVYFLNEANIPATEETIRAYCLGTSLTRIRPL